MVQLHSCHACQRLASQTCSSYVALGCKLTLSEKLAEKKATFVSQSMDYGAAKGLSAHPPSGARPSSSHGGGARPASSRRSGESGGGTNMNAKPLALTCYLCGTQHFRQRYDIVMVHRCSSFNTYYSIPSLAPPPCLLCLNMVKMTFLLTKFIPDEFCLLILWQSLHSYISLSEEVGHGRGGQASQGEASPAASPSRADG